MAGDEERTSRGAFVAAQAVARYERTQGTVAHSGLLQVWRRPHPLPATSSLENAPRITCPPDRMGTVLSLVPDVPEEHKRTEWLRFTVPPGAVNMHLRIHGKATFYLDGVEQQPVAHADETNVTVMKVNLAHPTALRRVCALRVETRPATEQGVSSMPQYASRWSLAE